MPPKYFTLFLLFTVFQLSAQNVADSTLQIGFAGSEPFVMQGKEPNGIVVDIWKEIAFNAQLSYVFKPYASVNEGMEAVKTGEVDALIGPVTINAQRAADIAFSQPFFDTEMGILAPILEVTLWERLKPLFSLSFMYAVFGFFLLLTLVGFLFWLAEGRKYPDDYGKEPAKGIGSGIWLALVTMTTVGYGDMAPKTTLGRFLIGTWMIISLIMATSFVAGIASTLSLTSRTDKTITTLNQLEGKKVAIPNYRKMKDNIQAIGGDPITVENIEQGYELLVGDKVEALVYDIVPLQYIFPEELKDRYALSRKNINPQHYGFVFPLNDELRHTVNIEILRLREAGEILQIIAGYNN